MAFEGMEAYEARAAEAERRLDALEKRLEEGGGAQDGAGQGGGECRSGPASAAESRRAFLTQAVVRALRTVSHERPEVERRPHDAVQHPSDAREGNAQTDDGGEGADKA